VGEDEEGREEDAAPPSPPLMVIEMSFTSGRAAAAVGLWKEGGREGGRVRRMDEKVEEKRGKRVRRKGGDGLEEKRKCPRPRITYTINPTRYLSA